MILFGWRAGARLCVAGVASPSKNLWPLSLDSEVKQKRQGTKIAAIAKAMEIER